MFLGVLPSAHAADATPVSADENLAKTEASPPASRSTIGLSPSSVSIETGTDKTTASVRIGDVWTSSDGVSVYHWGISAKTPFDSMKGDSVDLGTLSGLTAGTSAQIQGGWFYWPSTTDAELSKQKLCKAAIEMMVPGYSWYVLGDPDMSDFRYLNVGGKDQELGRSDCNAILTSYDSFRGAIDARNKATTDAPKPTAGEKPKAAQLPSRASFDVWSEKYRAAERAARVNGGLPMGITFAGSANRQKFSFADSASSPTRVTSTNKEGYGASVAGTVVGSWYVLGAGYEFSKSFNGGRQTQICTPIDTSSATSCANGALNSPTETTDHILFAESRAIVRTLRGIGLSPRLEYSAKTHDFGVQLPIYLVASKDRILDGGIKIGWTEEDHWGASIFVGKSFSFF